jgi:two-component system NtrC family response regulator
MSMRGRNRGGGDACVVSPSAFEWDPALVATLAHPSLPWDESLSAAPLADFADAGARDRVSLVAQFAAHQAFLQFAGTGDGDLDPAEWVVVTRRGSDVRLVRRGARRTDPTAAPIVLALIRDFASILGVRLDVFRHAWARADAVYVEAFERLVRDASADLRWVRASAAGAILAPGSEGLRLLDSGDAAIVRRVPSTLDAVRRFESLGASYHLVVLRGVSPLERYSALVPFAVDPSLTEAKAAERILAASSSRRHVFAIENDAAFDDGSRRVVDVLSRARHGAWLLAEGGEPLPESRRFLISPRLAVRTALDVEPRVFVQQSGFARYLIHGETCAETTALPGIAEPLRSFVGALALLGTSIEETTALQFLAEFLFTGSIEELVVPGVTRLEGTTLRFISEELRREASTLIPASSRLSIARVAAPHAAGERAAMLWMEAGDTAKAAAVLEATGWESAREVIDALHQVPADVLTPALRALYAGALIDEGRYRDARDLAAGDELLLARAERRMGDYSTALLRLERMAPSFEATLLRAEVLRLFEREPEAIELLETCATATADERVRLDYERSLHGVAVELPPDHYLAARSKTYRALEANDHEGAAAAAELSHSRARNVTERIDSALDLLFALFSAGRWDDARAFAVTALREVEETQGDRAAGGILFTLAYLAADEGQWAHSAHRIAQLRRFYMTTGDEVRLGELHLLQAHLDFSRGRFVDARREAESIWRANGHHGQIREAAALILDELDWMEGREEPMRARGRSGNAELTARHRRIAARDLAIEEPDDCGSVPSRLRRFRRAVRTGDHAEAQRIARELDLTFEQAAQPTEIELQILRAAATREYPFAANDFDIAWCHATRNRLGHWTTRGSYEARAEALEARDAGEDWIVSSERERLYLAGCASWSREGRESVAAIFRLRDENQRLRRVVAQEERPAAMTAKAIDGIIGQSAAVREVEALVARVATRDVPICILGESGTGKELIARAIHRQSPRRRKQFTAVNCAALPENLVESELFGHVRGAFTGADRDRAGLIETTDGGTLFLDEIGELPLPAQAKLLRFLQEGEFRRVGDVANRSADVRIVSATNRKLDTAVEEGRFRDDLYYRVRGVEVVLPPLRDRGADITLLASHFLAAERETHHGGPSALSPEVEAIFAAYRWPGNVRELQNTIRAAHAMAGEAPSIELEHLPERLRNVRPSRVPAGSYQHSVERFRRELITRSLAEADGNQNRAAAMLRMSRQALAYQIRELGILVRSAAAG